MIALTQADTELFMRASHDRNPLHWDDGRFAPNPFGRPVAHGMLSVLGLLGATRQRSPKLTRVVCRFLGPVFPGQAYACAFTEDTPKRVMARIRDHERVLLEATADYGARPTLAEVVRADHATAPRQEPAAWTWSELAPGRTVRTTAPSPPDELDQLVARFKLAERGIDRDQVAALAWCSYLVGMELPGRRALFSGVDIAFAARSGVKLTTVNGEARVDRLIFETRAVELVGAVEVGHTSGAVNLSAYVGPSGTP